LTHGVRIVRSLRSWASSPLTALQYHMHCYCSQC
jgi:hypothetical protein